MRIDVLTLFPEMFDGFINSSIIKRALEKEKVEIYVRDYRAFSQNKHRKVDDYGYGGGAGMIISVEPVVNCLRSIDGYEQAHKIITSPHGSQYNQQRAIGLSKQKHLIIICGHYEGIDHRIVNYIDEEISVGDFILTGGEIASLAIIDSVVRLLPGVLGNDESHQDESFMEHLLEYPQYTRPEQFENYFVPEVLLSGNHEKIRKWRRFKSLEMTYHKRPDLITKAKLTEEDYKFLELIKQGKSI